MPRRVGGRETRQKSGRGGAHPPRGDPPVAGRTGGSVTDRQAGQVHDARALQRQEVFGELARFLLVGGEHAS